MKIGTRVRPSRKAFDNGITSWKITPLTHGTVVGVPGPLSRKVRWDGVKTIREWHISFLRALAPEPPR